MLIFGDNKCVGYLSPRIKVYNLTSLLEGYTQLNILPYELKYSEEKEFDIAYAMFLLENPLAFYEMMRIIYNLYIGNDVYVLVSDDYWSDIITESLMKFIQQRYGYISNRIYEISDLDHLVDGEFSLPGVYNLDKDKDRFSYIITEIIIDGGGNINDSFDISSII